MYQSLSCGLLTPIPGDALPRTCIADGKFDAVAETKAVVAATCISFGTIMVDGDDGAIEQQGGFLTPPKSGKLPVKYVHI